MEEGMTHTAETRYTINPKTMLFENIDAKLQLDMLSVVEDLVLRGSPPSPQPAWVSDWMRQMGFNADQELMVMATAFPQRVLLSLVHALMLKPGSTYRCNYCDLVLGGDVRLLHEFSFGHMNEHVLQGHEKLGRTEKERDENIEKAIEQRLSSDPRFVNSDCSLAAKS
jgi:hypothetical protein